ncbi:MAG: DUF1080 domain-containing protein [Candidatus Azobacteroides sp.]|nr:DUF1080 domain-containing protein [Candidatus Azobacteroides sp.]
MKQVNSIKKNEAGFKCFNFAMYKKWSNKMKFLLLFFTGVVFLLFTTNCSGNSNKWKIGDKIINSATFDLQAGQSAIYAGDINGGNFKNFDFKAHVTHSDGAKASLWFHSDTTLSKGYSILIGNPSDDHRRSGSLASVRNLYKPIPSSFDLEVKVEGKRIVVMIDGWTVVNYLEPAVPYRTAANTGQLLSSGLIGFRVENGTLNVACANITPQSDNLPNYPEGRKPIDEQDDALIRLQQRNFPVIDYHVHCKGDLSLKTAFKKSLTDGYEFGIAANCGIGFQTESNEQIKALFATDFTLPPLFYGMQGEGREWTKTFSKEAREMFDYVFTDALTFYDQKGRRTQLWIPSTIFMDIPEQEYMDMIMDRTLKIIREEPIDFLASPTRLSNVMMKDYDKCWTDARVAELIKALKDNNVAMEINSVSKVPSARIIKAAKAAGIKFTLGTNNLGIGELDRLAYSLRMVEECGLTIDDMWFPKVAKERYSINPKKEEEKTVPSKLHQPKKVDISSFTLDGNGGAGIPITDKDGMITYGKGVSQEMLSGYLKIVNKYLEKQSKGTSDTIENFYWKSDSLSEKDWTRLYAVYFQMTDSQKQKQIITFMEPEPPQASNSFFPPLQRLYDSWVENPRCKIRIDGEMVDNDVLNSHEKTDFVRYFMSSLNRSGGKTGDYRVDLWTETGYDKFSEQLYGQPVSIDKLLKIEPNIIFLVEKDNSKPITLFLDPEPRFGWTMIKVTSISENNVYSAASRGTLPTNYHQKPN